jgi:methylmalonyl-CoA/ethylmalonyl-CoA epimerase
MAGAKGKTKKKPPAKPAKPTPRPKAAVKPAPRPAAKAAPKPPALAAKAPPKPAPVKAAAPAPKPAAPIPTPTPVLPPSAAKPYVPTTVPLKPGDFTLDKLHQIALTATNLDNAVDFYRDVLGLKFITRFDPPGLAFFALSGGSRLLLSTTASHASLYFLVDDIDKAVAALKSRGVSFLHPPSMIHRDDAGSFGKKGNEEWMAFFKDPSGNLLGLVAKK